MERLDEHILIRGHSGSYRGTRQQGWLTNCTRSMILGGVRLAP